MIYALENNVYTLGCDTEADIQNLPAYAESNHVKPGTTCYQVHGAKVYMMDSQGEWVAQN